MKEIKFKVGDVVKLKGNDQLMVIEGEVVSFGQEGIGEFSCTWFDPAGALQHGRFKKEIIEKQVADCEPEQTGGVTADAPKG